MARVMEEFFWVWVQRLLQPLFAEVQPYKVSAFDWTPTHWAQVAQQSQAVAHMRYAAMQAKEVEHQRKTAENVALAKQKDNATIGTFEL
jgi:hypothetical protein